MSLPRACAFGLALSLAALGCGDDDGGAMPADGGPPPPVDGGARDGGPPPPPDAGPPIDCHAAATECPPDPPMAGSACEGTFSCPYTYPGVTGIDWTFTCVVGAFEENLACGGCPPIPSESCRDPFAGSLAGGSVEVGPVGAGPFRPFVPGERIAPEFGGQGATMLFFRIRVNGEEPPACVSLHATVSLDGTASAATTLPVKLRCGESLRVFQIYPDNPCEERDYPVHLDAEVDGVGSTSLDLVLEGGGCPLGGLDGSDGGAGDADAGA